MVRLFDYGKDYYGCFFWFKIKQSGLELRFNTYAVDLTFGISVPLKDFKGVQLKLFNLEVNYFFRPDWY